MACVCVAGRQSMLARAWGRGDTGQAANDVVQLAVHCRAFMRSRVRG